MEVAKQIKQLDRDAIDTDGNLAKFQDTDIGKKYQDLKAKAAGEDQAEGWFQITRAIKAVGSRIDHRQIVVIWRETDGWQKADLERDKKFVAEQKLTEGADEVFVNGDSFIPNAKALEPVFKARMFDGVKS